MTTNYLVFHEAMCRAQTNDITNPNSNVVIDTSKKNMTRIIHKIIKIMYKLFGKGTSTLINCIASAISVIIHDKNYYINNIRTIFKEQIIIMLDRTYKINIAIEFVFKVSSAAKYYPIIMDALALVVEDLDKVNIVFIQNIKHSDQYIDVDNTHYQVGVNNNYTFIYEDIDEDTDEDTDEGHYTFIDEGIVSMGGIDE